MDNIILAIETSIKAGSLALIGGTQTIGSWTGNNDVSRSVDLLPQISRLLDENRIGLNRLQKIAVSVGPGSFTGIRVGIATAKALALVLDCRLIGVSLLEAIAVAEQSRPADAKTVVVSAGRDCYFWQKFQGTAPVAEAATGNRNSFENELGRGEMILAEQIAYDNLRGNNFMKKTHVVDGNCAELIGRCALEKHGASAAVAPLYIRSAVTVKT